MLASPLAFVACARAFVAVLLAAGFITAHALTPTPGPMPLPTHVAMAVWFEGDGDGGWQGFASADGQHPAYADDVRSVTVVDAEEATPAAVEMLLTMGAYTLPDDGEYVYAPTGVLVAPADGTLWQVDPDASYSGLVQLDPANPFGAGAGAVCGTDAQCQAYSLAYPAASA